MCTKSLCQVHNETASIYTHFLPALYILAHLVLLLTKQGVYEKIHQTQSRVILGASALSILFCMLASTSYHLYQPLNKNSYYFLLKMDLVGIGVMIFGLTLAAVYIGFHNWPTERDIICVVMGILMVGNMLIQMTPCYAMEKYEWHRIIFYCLTLVICLALAISGRFIYATAEEIELFYGMLWRSFLYLGVGFGFYLTKFPESKFGNSKTIQIWLNSHMWWHIFTFMNGYTLYWLAYDFCLYVENLPKNPKIGESNIPT